MYGNWRRVCYPQRIIHCINTFLNELITQQESIATKIVITRGQVFDSTQFSHCVFLIVLNI